ncbi:chitinase [Francisella sp. W12-1067]|nr:chitinase [Francisella sp. W12-1067]
MRYKKTFLATLAAFGSISALSAADIQPWSASKVSSYTPGTLVTEGGNTYKCKAFPEGSWCTIAAYEPIGIYGADAWDEQGPGPAPKPMDQHIVANVNITGDELPANAKVEFIDPDNNVHTVNNGVVDLDYAKGGSEYMVKLENAEGSISPSNVTVSSNSGNISLEYKEKVQPTPPGPTPPAPEGDCDPYDASKVPAYSDSSIYVAKDFAKYNGGIYEAKWWTQNAAPGTSDVWKYCGQAVETKVSVNTTGLPQTVKTFNVVIGGESYTIDSTRQTPIVLGQGSFDVSVPNILSSDALEVYIANKVTPNPIIIDESTKEVSLKINFKTKAVEVTTVSLNVTYATGTSPDSTTAKVTNSSGYDQTVQLVNGSNTISIPSQGEFTVTPDSYKERGETYKASPLTIVDGKVVDTDVIAYEKVGNWPERVMAGYWGTWTNGQSSNLASYMESFGDYYNVILPGFLLVKGTTVNNFADAVILENFVDGVDRLHKKGALVIASVGGANTSVWAPDLNNVDTLAKNIVNFLAENHLDGLDFDLEGSSIDGSEAWTESMQDLIAKMRENAEARADDFPRGFFITSAPQTYEDKGVEPAIYWTDSQAKPFAAMLNPEACGGKVCFDAILIQNYNNLNAPGWPNQPPTQSVKIAANALKVAKNNVTQIVLGDDFAPSESSYVSPEEYKAVFDKGDAYGPAINSYSNFNGFMVWSLGQTPTTIDPIEFAKQMEQFYPISTSTK